MSDTAWGLELDLVSGTEQIFKDEVRARDNKPERNEARLVRSASLKGVSPVDALIRI